jgi:hypothetical protein
MQKKIVSLAEKNWVYLVLLGLITILFCNRILFTDQIIRASDVITQYFWGARAIKDQSMISYFTGTIPTSFQASWGPLPDGGRTLEGGWNANYLLFYERLIQHYLPFPASIAWLSVLSLLWGGVGTFLYCRLIGVSHIGAFAAGLLFALCTENASLINAGHIQKIETISWFPWVIYFLEKALRSRRLYHYAMTSLMLGVQFFNMHWQISFYTCLTVAVYWFFFVGKSFIAQKGEYIRSFRKDFLLAFVMVLLFFSTIAMSFAPLLSWSRQSERSGGMSTEEGMSWSMPPEELTTFAVPGLFGYSRQEGGDVPKPGQVYYWGRMHFTQTNDYLGLLPWLLVPLTLFFRRDRYTWVFTFLAGATLVMALGKYTAIYRLMFEYLPGFSTFRVPKMILFVFAFSIAVLMGRGIDCLDGLRDDRKALRRWIAGVAVFVGSIGILWFLLSQGKGVILSLSSGLIDQPTRYQADSSLVMERYGNMLREAGISFGVGCLYLAAIYTWFRRWLSWRVFLPALIIILLMDLWRVNDNFFVLTHPPESNKKKSKNEVVSFLENRIGNYRMQPLNDESAHYYAEFGLANISAYVTISEKRYKEFLDTLSLTSRMPDMMNLKYLVMPLAEFQAQRGSLEPKYMPVFTSSNGSVVVENRSVLPKAWLVPQVAVVPDPGQRLAIMSNSPEFDPSRIAIVEKEPLLPMFTGNISAGAGTASVEKYEPNLISVKASTGMNALLVLGEKYYRWWYAYVDGKRAEIVPVNHILRGVYLPPGQHTVVFRFDPLPFKVGKYLTLGSFALFIALAIREFRFRRRRIN